MIIYLEKTNDFIFAYYEHEYEETDKEDKEDKTIKVEVNNGVAKAMTTATKEFLNSQNRLKQLYSKI